MKALLPILMFSSICAAQNCPQGLPSGYVFPCPPTPGQIQQVVVAGGQPTTINTWQVYPYLVTKPGPVPPYIAVWSIVALQQTLYPPQSAQYTTTIISANNTFQASTSFDLLNDYPIPTSQKRQRLALRSPKQLSLPGLQAKHQQ